jgi:hypothetical protein
MHMTRLFLITLLVLSSGSAYAEWERASSNDQVGLTIYIDPDTIRVKENLVKMWILYDFMTIQADRGGSFWSRKVQTEFDCLEERHRSLTFTDFSGNMGNGEMVYNNSNEHKWEPVEPESVDQTLWKVACNKK